MEPGMLLPCARKSKKRANKLVKNHLTLTTMPNFLPMTKIKYLAESKLSSRKTS